MPLPIPDLDDRDYAQLVAEAKALIPAHCPEWTDLSPGDPGTALLELFSYLTDAMLFRLNRLPDKAFVAFLDLVGVTLTPPAAASAEITVTLRTAAARELTLPRGARITTAGAGPVFTTRRDLVIPAGATSGTVVALHCDLIPAEQIGVGTGQGGQRCRVARPPIVLDSGDGADLLIGVETLPGEFDQRVPVIRHDGVSYRLWRETSHFGVQDRTGDPYVFRADRADGLISFAPAVRHVSGPEAALLAAVPPAGRRIRAWYRSGGGAEGNVNAGMLTVLKDPPAGAPALTVTNLAPATGGRDTETLDNALLRGPHQVTAYERVVTARDYERLAVSASGGVSRALALTRSSLWPGAPAGEVQVLLVPSVDDADALTVSAAQLRARQSDLVVARVADALAEQQPLGARTRVGWAGLKEFHAVVDVVVHRAEDRAAITARLRDRLRRALTPMPVDGGPGAGGEGWPFGEPLRASTVYDVLLAERGVRYVDSVRLVVDAVPTDVLALVADPHADRTWFCGSGGSVFRSTDDADGWERVAAFAGDGDDLLVDGLAVCPGLPGLLVASARLGRGDGSRLHLSWDYGETWSSPAEFSFHVEDLALGAVNGRAVAFLATDNGLFRLDLTSTADGATPAVPEAVIVRAESPAQGFYAVEVVSDPGDDLQVAVAAQELGGVFLSFRGGRDGTFQPLGLTGVDVRLLRTQRTPGRRFLLTGAFATGEEAGAGVSRLELLPYQPSQEGWRPVGANWVGGSCRDLAPVGDRIFAATARAAVTVGDTSRDGAPWRVPSVDCGLPLREVGRFQPLFAVAAAGELLLAGCVGGVFATRDGRTWSKASEQVFSERISLPRTWLFAPGEHELTVRYDDGDGRDARG